MCYRLLRRFHLDYPLIVYRIYCPYVITAEKVTLRSVFVFVFCSFEYF